MTDISKNISFDVLDDTVDKYNNTTEPIEVMTDYYVEYNEISNQKNL